MTYDFDNYIQQEPSTEKSVDFDSILPKNKKLPKTINEAFAKFTKHFDGGCLFHGAGVLFNKADRPLWLTGDYEMATSYSPLVLKVECPPMNCFVMKELLSRTDTANIESNVDGFDEDFVQIIRYLHSDYPQNEVDAMVEKYMAVGLKDTHWGVIDIHDSRVTNKILRLGFDIVSLEDVPDSDTETGIYIDSYVLLNYKKSNIIEYKDGIDAEWISL